MTTLYTCGQRTRLPALHPCAKAARALDEAGVAYEIETVGGYRGLPWTRRGQRERMRELSGQEDVPVLVTDDGQVVSGTTTIVRWAAERRAPTPSGPSEARD